MLSQALDMVAFIKSKGKAGASAGKINKEFGTVPPSLQDFIDKRIEAVQLEKTGAGNAPKYTAAD